MGYNNKAVKQTVYALVAQLDRVSDYESEGQGFESLRARQKKPHEIAVFWLSHAVFFML